MNCDRSCRKPFAKNAGGAWRHQRSAPAAGRLTGTATPSSLSSSPWQPTRATEGGGARWGDRAGPPLTPPPAGGADPFPPGAPPPAGGREAGGADRVVARLPLARLLRVAAGPLQAVAQLGVAEQAGEVTAG